MFGDWSISKECFDFVVANTPPAGIILEFGSGWASGQLSERFEVYSVENDLWYLGKHNTNYIYAHMRWYGWGAWYDIDEMLPQLPTKVPATIIVDGPAAGHSRRGFVHFLTQFNTDALIIICDVQREQENLLWHELREQLGRPSYTIGDPAKMYGVIERNDR